MPRSTCEPCCNPSELARSLPTYRDAHLQILCQILTAFTQGGIFSQETVLGSLIGVDMNSTADQPIEMNSGSYIVTRLMVLNGSVPISTAEGGVYVEPSKVDPIFLPGAPFVLPNPASYFTVSPSGIGAGSIISSSTLYASLTTPEGSPATADWYVIGYKT